MKKIKIAQIGTSRNSHGASIWNSLTKQSDIFEPAGYALPEGERKKFPERISVFDGYPELTVQEILDNPEIEAVAIETEEVYLTKYAIMAGKAGKHLHMEKPGSADPCAFESLIAILKEKKLVFSLGYMYRFNPKIKEAIEKIARGELGEIYSIEAHMNCKQSAELRKWLENFPGGMMFFLGCHLVDLIYRIQGEPSEVIPLNCATRFDGVSSKDYGMALFKYPNGISFAKSCGSEFGGFLRRQLVICGEKGTLEIKPLETLCDEGQFTVMNESYSTNWHEPWTATKTEAYDRYDDMLRNFAEMVRGKENPYTYDYELNLHRLLLKACGYNFPK
ncbi:MAG: Gfo/Idh/MocA family oxidoreductase [Oscillospiraceae bacterium]|nr:Gfo/Idh/MocA family oxidoreductase [Oscillospiraceae bacterium]MBQ3224477.1 Gfo/Idh/MocA family oxidoreductase [Oscillospiraceae bacterium]